MKKGFKMVIAAAITAVMGFGTAAVLAFEPTANSPAENDLPEGASTMTSVFNVMEDMDAPGTEFSMISKDGELIIHINENTPVYFEDYVPMGDEPEDGVTRDAREVLFGRTLAEVLDGRNLTVTYAITTRSIPPQTSPISIMILFEKAVHPIAEIDTSLEGNGDFSGFVTLPASLLPFTDVDVNDWFFASVAWALENGIMNGMSETEFSPDGTMTRAMLVTVLWRYAGEPDAGELTFDDVPNGAWFSEAIAWAAENGIVTGIESSIFAPDDNVNREQMYTILYRYMNFMEIDIKLDEEMRLQQFADDDLVSDWAREALHFMFDAGIMFTNSSLDNNARPQIDATRAEIAAAMYFFDMLAQ